MWTKVKSARRLKATPNGTRVRIVGERCAEHFLAGGILTHSQNVELGEYSYGIHTPRQTCFKFNFKNYKIWEPQQPLTTKKI